ncbi:MAG: hypothetical protein IPP73_00505 [Chitinophagaceae bacterium]|nr:hypothetical protein [Chitinophagaceae bacterium]
MGNFLLPFFVDDISAYSGQLTIGRSELSQTTSRLDPRGVAKVLPANDITGIDSVFQSLILIEGTKENEISFLKEFIVYEAILADTVKEKKGQQICDEWKSKLEAILGYKIEDDITTIYGWEFYVGNLSISVTLMPFPGSKNTRAYLSLMFSIDATEVKQGQLNE